MADGKTCTKRGRKSFLEKRLIPTRHICLSATVHCFAAFSVHFKIIRRPNQSGFSVRTHVGLGSWWKMGDRFRLMDRVDSAVYTKVSYFLSVGSRKREDF